MTIVFGGRTLAAFLVLGLRLTRGMLRRDLRMFLFDSTRTLEEGGGIIYTKVKRRKTS